MRQVVIGAGQIGRALAEVLDCEVVDVHDGMDPCDVLHIAFGWSPAFDDEVRRYVGLHTPRLVVIHSTVPVGTSRRLGAVHSPVTGKHPNLAPSIRTFVKFFGGRDAAEAAALFAERGVRTQVVADQETTEAGKLWATLQYGLLIAIQKEAYRFAERHHADPDIAYRRFNEVYNEGYAALGEPHYLPTLVDMPGPIGGHCVIPNAGMTDSPLADLLLDLNDAW